MKDNEIKLEETETSHTLGGAVVGCHVRVEEEVVYYESRKREIKIRLMNEGRNDERPKDRVGEIHECDG